MGSDVVLLIGEFCEIPEFGINIVSSGLTIDNFSHVDDFVQYIISANQDSLNELTCNPATGA